jgi:aldehyde dehydrogenase (NAD+)
MAATVPPKAAPSVAELFESMAYGPAPEGDAEARRWIAERGGEGAHYIAGQWYRAKDAALFDVHEPATGAVLARMPQGTADDVDRAVRAARAAQPAWAALGGHGRARHLYALARAVQKHARLLAVLESLDNGKSIRETRDLDIPLVARHFYHHAGWAQLAETEFAGYGPLGVVGQIIPWNFPLLMLAWKVAPALARGTRWCSSRPSSRRSRRCASRARARRGAAGRRAQRRDRRRPTGAALVAHDGVDKIAFTGSTDVGRIIRRETAGTGKKLSLELGGKSPFVVFEDADLDSVVEGVVDAICSTRARCAAPARGCSCRRASTTGWSRSSSAARSCSASAARSTRRSTWARWSRRCSSSGSRRSSSRGARRAAWCGSRPRPVPPTGGSTRRRW